MNRKPFHTFLIAFVFLAISASELLSQSNTGVFDFDGRSQLTLLNKSNDSVNIEIENYVHIPRNEQMASFVLPPQDSIDLKIEVQTHHYYLIKVNGKLYRIFSTPGGKDNMSFNTDKEVTFDGDHAAINYFLKKRKVKSDWQPRGKWHYSGTPEEIIRGNDSISKLQISQLDSFPDLPEWYTSFETERIKYNGVQSAMGAIIYRKKLFNDTLSIPKDFVSTLIDNNELTIENESFSGNISYMRFLSSFVLMKWDPNLTVPIPNDTTSWKNEIESRLKCVDTLLKNSAVRDIYFTSYIMSISEKANSSFYAWIDKIENEEYKARLIHYLNNRKDRSAMYGVAFPDLKLLYLNGDIFDKDQLKGKITLVNFWATWCRPCYKEIPSENKLVEKFKNDSIQIINICIDSKRKDWIRKSNEIELKMINLYADESESQKINKQLKTYALPHSLLLDEKGNIFMNDCPSANSGVEVLISQLLRNQKNHK
tara:strand:+ start:4885 stop:6330 length:1446 start_codon:yes stop_codon:yes gene_type:complete